MREATIPSEVDIHSYEGLTRLFRFGIELKDDHVQRNALALAQNRFGLPSYNPEARGALEDAVRHLDRLKAEDRFEKVFDLIAAANDRQKRLDPELSDELVRISSNHKVVRFSFSPAILPCLRHAQTRKMSRASRSDKYATRYAGIGSDVKLVAFASLFLNIPVYAEVNPPWDPDVLFDNEEPNFEPPDVEITFPPESFRIEDAPHLEKSVRKSQIPRAVDRGKYDLESVMLEYLSDAPGSALAFVSQNFVLSTRQACLKTRQQLLHRLRIKRVAELTNTDPPLTVIELSQQDDYNENIEMLSTNAVKSFLDSQYHKREIRGVFERVAVMDISSAGDSLNPTRYLANGPTGGHDVNKILKNKYTPTKYKLVDLFEIIRPKATKDDPVGKLRINEVRPSDISEFGDLSVSSRTIHVKLSSELGLLEQKIKAGDILFAHRGPIGRVAYINQASVEASDIWAAQSLLIFRPRKQLSGRGKHPFCDPRVLFMYLSTQEVRDRWNQLAVGDRSPAIPIGEIERFGLHKNLLMTRKHGRFGAVEGVLETDRYSRLIIAEFEARQANLVKIRVLEAAMKSGLDRTWNLSWSTDSSQLQDNIISITELP